MHVEFCMVDLQDEDEFGDNLVVDKVADGQEGTGYPRPSSPSYKTFTTTISGTAPHFIVLFGVVF